MSTSETTLAADTKERLYQAAELLLQARRNHEPIDDLPPEVRPKTLEEAYFVQDRILEALGTQGGWKVGAPSPEATPLCAPMPLAGFGESGETAEGHHHRMRGVEAEVAYKLGKDLPQRDTPYTREEVVDAIECCAPAIEVLESGLLNPDTADRLSSIADLQSNGGFVAGNAYPGWRDLDLSQESAQMNVDGFVRVTGGKNAAGGDLLRLVLWLANDAQQRTRGLKAGQWITTGSWTGKTLADSGSVAVASFQKLGEVRMRFA